MRPSGSQSYSTALRCHPVLAPRIGSVGRRNKLLMIATLAVIPLLIVFKKSSDRGGDHAAIEL